MRVFEIHYPDDRGVDVCRRLSEYDILREYFPYWYDRMCEKYGEEYVNDNYRWDHCLEDWIVVNWAKEIV